MIRIQLLKLLVILICFMSSCTSRYPDDVEVVLKRAGQNSEELIKAIDYFENLGNEKKLQAVYYLIAGMKDKYSYSEEVYKLTNEKLARADTSIDSLNKLSNIDIKEIVGLEKKIKNELCNSLNLQRINEVEKIEDCKIITANYIIKNVEQAFEAWNMPWAKNVSFDQFCEYILPYKIGNEFITNWREKVLEDYAWAKDDLSGYSLIEVCKILNDSARSNFVQKIDLDYPLQLDYNTMKFLGKGSCEHCTNYVICVMRGLGVPVSKEISPFLNTIYHKWPALHMENDKIVPFEACTPKNNFDLIYDGSLKNIPDNNIPAPYRKITKVERFVYNDKCIENSKNLNIGKDKYDVTSQYTSVSEIKLNVKYSFLKKRIYSLSIFDRKSWVPKHFSTSRTNDVEFENIANGIIYLPQIINDDGVSSPAGNPFLLNSSGYIQEIKLDKKNRQNLTLERKFPLEDRIQYFGEKLVGSRFQVANSIDFKDSVTINVITKAPTQYYHNIDINLDSKYQYFRILFPQTPFRVSIAEIEVFDGINNNPIYGKFIGENILADNMLARIKRVFDKDPLSYAESQGDKFSWIGMDFGKPINLEKIRYLQRSDLNMIIPGNKYELVYWDSEWVSLGVQTATENNLVYKNVPKNALFLLHNVTEGKEERVFTYENGVQKFY